MSHTTSSVFGNFGNTAQIMPLLDRPHGSRGLSNIELAQINLNANIAKKANQTTKRNAVRKSAANVLAKAMKRNQGLEQQPLTANNQAELNRVRANQERAALMISIPPPLPTGPRPAVPKSPVSLPPIPNRPLPKMTKTQEKKWENYTRTHPSVMLGMTAPTRPLPPLPVEGARRKTRRTRKNKTRRQRR